MRSNNMTITNETRIEALKEASISIACCLDEVSEVTKEDLEHIQSQLCILENYEDEEEVRNRKLNRKLTRELKADIRYMRNED
jgi:AMMECR1 domain-containing protein